MIAIFSLRLAVGSLACLLILPSAVVNPRFYRTHFLTAFGLVLLAAIFRPVAGSDYLLPVLVVAGVFCFAGSVVFLLEGAPGGFIVMIGALAAATCSLVLTGQGLDGTALADQFTGAAVLGGALSAMLMGHSYLIAPAMSLVPLMRLLAVLAGALVLRMALATVGLWYLAGHSATVEKETLLWLAARWLVGLVIPLILCWMAWETAKIRSTQSATGILYVVVVLCFLGELTSLLLQSKTDFVL